MGSQYGSYNQNSFHDNFTINNNDQFNNHDHNHGVNGKSTNFDGIKYSKNQQNNSEIGNFGFVDTKDSAPEDAFLMNNVINFDMSPEEIDKQFNLEILNDLNSDIQGTHLSNQTENMSFNSQNTDFINMNQAIENINLNNNYDNNYTNRSLSEYLAANSNNINANNEKKTPLIQVSGAHNGSGSGSGIPSTSSYQSPAPVSIAINSSSASRNEAFSPESLGFSSNIGSNQLGKTLSNTLGRSFGDQLGSSLNNLVSPTTTFDGIPDSSYGSYDDSFLRSPLNSPSLKSIGSPSSGTHMNPKSALSKESKISRRRELHNAVERRRRDLIKEKIKELGFLIPPTMLYDPSKPKQSKDAKVNKNVILQKSVEYIIYLHEILEAQDNRINEMQNEIEHLDLNDTGVEQNFISENNTDSRNTLPIDSQTLNTNNNDDDADESTNSLMNMVSGNVNSNSENTDFDLAAFSDTAAPKSVNSKLKFMDFSNNGAEALDFSKLSDSGVKRLEETNNQSNDMLSFGFKTNMTNAYNDMNQTPNAFTSTQDDFNNFLNEPTLKFESDTDFLDQLLSKEPVRNAYE